MNGVIVINKPSGMTSHDVVTELRKSMFLKSIGHAGTLDPLATGVLPILISKGTRISKYLVDHDKEYIATLKLGEKTSTGDITGEIIEEKELPEGIWNLENIKDVLASFIGKQEQVPPMYSAIKVNGKKLYEYARIGETIEVKPRQIEIYNIDLIDLIPEKRKIKFKVFCSKGTYIRTICEDLAKELGTVGTMSELIRTKAGQFVLEKAIDLDVVKTLFNEEIEAKYLIGIEEAFIDYKKIILRSDNELKLFLNGMMLIKKMPNDVYRVYDKDSKFIGLGVIQNNILKRDVVL